MKSKAHHLGRNKITDILTVRSAFRPSASRMKVITQQCEEKLLKASEEDLNEFSEK